jgi:serine O-acetyltransferase
MSTSRTTFRERVRNTLRNAPKGSFMAVVQLMREDYWAHGAELSRPGFRAIAAYRLGHWLLGAPRAARVLLRPLYRHLFVRARNVYGIEIPAESVIGRRVRFAHQHGITVHAHSVIGDDCLIRHNVTLGAVNDQRLAGGPVLGDRVELSPGVVIVGRVKIGAGARIGPNCVITTNIPEGATVVTSPPRVLQVPRRPVAGTADTGAADTSAAPAAVKPATPDVAVARAATPPDVSAAKAAAAAIAAAAVAAASVIAPPTTVAAETTPTVAAESLRLASHDGRLLR